MTKHFNRLKAPHLGRLTARGMYADGDGLYLQVNSPASRCWVFRYQVNGRERRMGLGSLRDISLAQAREKMRELRGLIREGIDPIDQRRASRTATTQAQEQAQEQAIDFDACSAQYIKIHASSWSNEKHRQQWESTLRTYASPVFGHFPVSKIDTTMVLRVLEPIWSTKTETAARLRERIEKVLTWATVRGYREGDNPARWKGHLQGMLPKPTRLKRVEHHAALAFQSLPEFFKELRDQGGMAARALELLILTACRTTEVIEARWLEIDLDACVWVIPAQRMKAGQEHRVPLSSVARALLQTLKESTGSGEWVFAGLKPGRPLSNMAMLKLLERMNRKDITVHGFRSTFRDWVAETTNFQREVAEMALAHSIGSAVEAAYRRGDLFGKRCALMQQWATFCVFGGPNMVAS